MREWHAGDRRRLDGAHIGRRWRGVGVGRRTARARGGRPHLGDQLGLSTDLEQLDTALALAALVDEIVAEAVDEPFSEAKGARDELRGSDVLLEIQEHLLRGLV